MDKNKCPKLKSENSFEKTLADDDCHENDLISKMVKNVTINFQYLRKGFNNNLCFHYLVNKVLLPFIAVY